MAGALLVAVAVGLRLAVAIAGRTVAMENGRAVIRDPDACYHLRRAALIADRFPDLALFDSYLNHPRGAHVIWPPLYDLVLAGALRMFPAEAPGTSAAVALLPPFLFAGAVLVIFRAVRRVWPDRARPRGVAGGWHPRPGPVPGAPGRDSAASRCRP